MSQQKWCNVTSANGTELSHYTPKLTEQPNTHQACNSELSRCCLVELLSHNFLWAGNEWKNIRLYFSKIKCILFARNWTIHLQVSSHSTEQNKYLDPNPKHLSYCCDWLDLCAEENVYLKFTHSAFYLRTPIFRCEAINTKSTFEFMFQFLYYTIPTRQDTKQVLL